MSLWSRIANTFRADRLTREIDEEIQSHIADAIEDGRDPAEARRAFGPALLRCEESRDVRLVTWLDSLLRDIRYGLSSLVREPGFAITAVGVLALGIGANTAMFTVVDVAFMRPMRLPQPERLVQIQESPPQGGFMPVAYPDFVDWEKQSRSFESMGIAGVFAETLKRSGGNERIQVAYVSPGFHVVCGVKPQAGRALAAADDRAAAPPAAFAGRRDRRAGTRRNEAYRGRIHGEVVY